jgi:hypothetical protein
MYRRTIGLTGPGSTLIEWDEEIPELDVPLAQADEARAIRDRVNA